MLVEGLKSRMRCTEVPLDSERGIVRLCESSDLHLDLALCQGGSLDRDLSCRDFSINAMALDERGALGDPYQGWESLERGEIRCLSEATFPADPLRVLRAFRFAAVLGFSLEEQTRALLLENIAGLERVAGERISGELFAFLEATDERLLGEFQESEILETVLGRPISGERWSLLLAWYAGGHRSLPRLSVREGRTVVGLAALAIILGPESPTEPPSKNFGLERLRMSRDEVRFLKEWRQGERVLLEGGGWNKRRLLRLKLEAGSALAGLLSVAALPESPFCLSPEVRERASHLTEGWGEMRGDPMPWTGVELCHSLELSPGPWVGRLLKEAEAAWRCQEVGNESELLEHLRVFRSEAFQDPSQPEP